MLTLRQIEVFRVVMRTRTIISAAAELHISQPTITKLLERMEHVLKLPLFNRSPGKIVPTIEARRLLAEIDGAYEGLEAAVNRAANAAQADDGLFRVGTQPSLARNLVPRALARLQLMLPKLSFHLDVLSVAEVLNYLREGPGECALSIFPVVSADVVTTECGAANLVALIPQTMTLARSRAPLSATKAAQVPLITFEPHAIHCRVVNEFFATEGVRPSKSHMVRFTDSAVGMAEAGLGIAIVDEFSAQSADRSRVTVRKLKFDGVLPVYLHRSLRLAQSRLSGAFERALQLELAHKPRMP